MGVGWELDEVVKMYKLPVIRYISPRDVKDNMTKITNMLLCYI